MNVHAFIENARASAKNRTKEQRASLLKKANILDNNGHYLDKYFSSDTVRKDKGKQKTKA